MNNYKKLEIWKEAIDLASSVYQLSKKFPKDEIFGLTSQLRRCGVSIPSNIAEGSGRNSNKEFLHFLGIARASCCELETQLIIAEKLGSAKTLEIEPLILQSSNISGMSVNLMKRLRS